MKLSNRKENPCDLCDSIAFLAVKCIVAVEYIAVYLWSIQNNRNHENNSRTFKI